MTASRAFRLIFSVVWLTGTFHEHCLTVKWRNYTTSQKFGDSFYLFLMIWKSSEILEIKFVDKYVFHVMKNIFFIALKKLYVIVKEKQLKSVQLVNSCLQTILECISWSRMRNVHSERNCNLGKLKLWKWNIISILYLCWMILLLF